MPSSRWRREEERNLWSQAGVGQTEAWQTKPAGWRGTPRQTAHLLLRGAPFQLPLEHRGARQHARPAEKKKDKVGER